MNGPEKAKLKKLTKMRYTQREIAKEMNYSKTAVLKWQRRLGLKPKGARTGIVHLREKEEALRHRLWKDGYTDCQAAKLAGCSRESFRDWRKRRELPSNEGLPVITEYDMRHYAPDVEEFWETLRG